MECNTLSAVILFFVVLILKFNVQRVASELTQIVQTDKGPVQGIVLSTVAKHMRYSAFKGIPYAKPPIGNFRYKPPVEIEPWQSIRNCEKEGDICIQQEWLTGLPIGSESCLFLNVYTPVTNIKKDLLKAVMVWIHGGSLLIGSGNQDLYGPDFLLEADVVVVTLNYRLGAFGFLAINHPEVLGNAGLKDQNFALRWIKRNIINFGGDPNKVTIMGQSSGAVSIDYHVLSELSRGLFQRSISMSGAPICPWGFTTIDEAERQAYNLGLLLNNGKNITNTDALLAIFRNSSATDIMLKTAELIKFEPFTPTLENPNIAKDQEKFITKCYLEKYKTGNYTKLPHMLGFTSDENLAAIASTNDEWVLIKEQMLSYVQGLEPLSSFISKSIDDHLSQNVTKSSLERLVQLLSDIYFVTGIDLKQQFMSNSGNPPIYYYRNSFDAKNDSFHYIVLNSTLLNGTAHADDLYYIFYSGFMKNVPLNPDRPLSITRSRMIKMWTNFAKYANPTPEGTGDKLLNIIWPDSRSTGAYLEISNQLSVNNTRPISETVSTLQKHLKNKLVIPSGCNDYKT